MKAINKSFQKFFFALLIIGAISFSINSSYAQSTVSLGVKGGANIATFRGEDVKDYDNRTAFNFGLLLNYSVAEKVGLSLEADYASMGAKYDGSILGIETGEYTTKLDYLRTSLLFNYYMGTTEMDIRPELFVGPYVGFLMGANSKYEDGDYNDVKDAYNATDFGATFGAGLHLKVGERMWLVPDVRYNLGLVDIFDNNNFEGRNGVLSVNLGLTFPLN